MGNISCTQVKKLSRNFLIIGVVMLIVGLFKWPTSVWISSFIAGSIFILLAGILATWIRNKGR